MSKLIMLSGLPASGKSTAARKTVKEYGSAGRINRDDLRAMIFNSEWSGKREGIIVECEKAIAQILLKNKVMPLIDDTNLSDRHLDLWKNFSKENGVTFEVQKLKTDLATCIERDSKRDKPIGEAIITRMALNAGMIPFDDRNIVIVDIDGTVSCGEHREKYILNKPKDWKKYFSLSHLDTPYQHIIDQVNELSKTNIICMVTGRPDTYQHETINWLRNIGKVNFDYIFMRAGNDSREDTIIKQEILDKMPKNKVILALDDRKRIIEMYRNNGIKTIAVRGEDMDF